MILPLPTILILALASSSVSMPWNPFQNSRKNPRDNSNDLLIAEDIQELTKVTKSINKALPHLFLNKNPQSRHWKPKEKKQLTQWRNVADRIVLRMDKQLEPMSNLIKGLKYPLIRATLIESIDSTISKVHRSFRILPMFSDAVADVRVLNFAGEVDTSLKDSAKGEDFTKLLRIGKADDPKALLAVAVTNQFRYRHFLPARKPLATLPFLYHILTILRVSSKVSLSCEEIHWTRLKEKPNLDPRDLSSIPVLEDLKMFSDSHKDPSFNGAELQEPLTGLIKSLQEPKPSCPYDDKPWKNFRGIFGEVKERSIKMIEVAYESLKALRNILKKGSDHIFQVLSQST
ncbi:hypothetical protein BJ684DRAFT_14843 [Piptocephalis cylindrospora]|uniref:Uncharacterized protein n=1 Tax=Piptocephalis cylindrospora TaxID=1907219 RepID=A0A4P9Y738_9FUNG|nr:hypothetical protein BJ684DRAFT_14843 [Piptocephalis cylindrospora]|eukprot:RKP14865.1 hypothetical protein BJ684DRAFT_14843 [Piptocephalis cylindrospora]